MKGIVSIQHIQGSNKCVWWSKGYQGVYPSTCHLHRQQEWRNVQIILGKNQFPGTIVAHTSNVSPISTMISAKILHHFPSVPNKEEDARLVNSMLAPIPQSSRTKKFKSAESAVAPWWPNPTPSSTRWVARTLCKWLDRSWIQLQMEYCKYPGGVDFGHPEGRNADRIPADTWLMSPSLLFVLSRWCQNATRCNVFGHDARCNRRRGSFVCNEFSALRLHLYWLTVQNSLLQAVAAWDYMRYGEQAAVWVCAPWLLYHVVSTKRNPRFIDFVDRKGRDTLPVTGCCSPLGHYAHGTTVPLNQVRE